MTQTHELTEEAAASQLGVTRDAFKKLRAEHLYENDDWRKKGREIVITKPGLERLRGVLAALLKKDPSDSGPGDAVAPGAIPGVVTAIQAVASAVSSIIGSVEQKQADDSIPLKVTRTVLNPHIVRAVREDGKEVSVWVTTNKNFLPNMEIRAVHRVGELYDLVGRCPRFRGRF